MPQVQRNLDYLELMDKLPFMPWYVDQFINYKLPDKSPTTLLEYIRDYEIFFNYLIAEGISSADKITDISLETLEKLPLESITGYKHYLSIRNVSKKKDSLPISKSTISRRISSLRSLFSYLSQFAEDENLYPLLKRNVMAKIPVQKMKKPEETASRLSGKLLQENEIDEFIEFIANSYPSAIGDKKRALVSYYQNKVRDACIVSLILHSGLRVSEVVNLNLNDIDMTINTVYVFRKGGTDEAFKTPVNFRKEVCPALSTYLSIRVQQYKNKKDNAFFLALPNGKSEGNRMSKRAIQDMIIKYAKAFGKPFLTVHKLRHSFATDYYLSNDLYKTQSQLGHASPQTTQIYAHLTDKTMSEAIDRRNR
ncbi:tyrosine recombinase XerS [Paenibacillus sp. LS1]|uniref:tyrosine recombinase XerS n=1 Tax=Paenibacillus sp. LS1 TaxID=2992120 RepID=UPI00222F08AA|nr:tyrosine recombinase XerS [Paenibacillus sp. LS1]MCW3793801.1 tyrosine recombinase XerS [Paenibacillus sp. LS1]